MAADDALSGEDLSLETRSTSLTDDSASKVMTASTRRDG